MTFFVKFFTIVSAALAVAVNGSPAGSVEGGLEARSNGGWVIYCIGGDDNMFHCTPGRGEYIIEFGTCYNPGKVLTFSRELIMDCVGYPDNSCQAEPSFMVRLENPNHPDDDKWGWAGEGGSVRSYRCEHKI